MNFLTKTFLLSVSVLAAQNLLAAKSTQSTAVSVFPVMNTFKQMQIGSQSPAQKITFSNNSGSAVNFAANFKGPDANQFSATAINCNAVFTEEWNGTSNSYSTVVDTVVNGVSNGALNLTSTSDDPWVEMYSLGSFPAADNPVITMRYRVVSGSTLSAQIFFTVDGENATAVGPKHVNTSLISDGGWHTANFDMAGHPLWQGTITGWRFDWATANGVTMEIDYITLGGKLPSGETCSADVVFNPTRFGSKTAYIDAGNGMVAFLSNDEDRQMEAKRRFPAVLTDIKVFDGSTEVDITTTALEDDTTYTLQWTLLGYEDAYKSNAEFYACGTSEPGAGNTCWGTAINAVSDESPAVSAQTYWRYYDQYPQLFTFSTTFSINGANLTNGENYVGLRLFYQGEVDINDSAKPPVSLILPGNVENIASPSNKSGYIGNNGRRMFIKVTK